MTERPIRIVKHEVLRDLMERLNQRRQEMLQRYNMDSRDQGRDQRQEVIMEHDGIWECTFVGECSVVCPKDVDPAGAIQRAKLKGTMDWFKQWVMPRKGGTR